MPSQMKRREHAHRVVASKRACGRRVHMKASWARSKQLHSRVLITSMMRINSASGPSSMGGGGPMSSMYKPLPEVPAATVRSEAVGFVDGPGATKAADVAAIPCEFVVGPRPLKDMVDGPGAMFTACCCALGSMWKGSKFGYCA